MSRLEHGGTAESSSPGARPDGERSPAEVLEHFDFEHAVFMEDTWADAKPEIDELPEPVDRWVEEMKSLVARQAGAAEVLMALDDVVLNAEQDADRYVMDRLHAGSNREQVRTEVQAVYDALEDRIHETAFPVSESNKTLDKAKN